LADGKNNDASIAKSILLNTEVNILDWLEEHDVSVVDRGFRDAVNTMNRFGSNVQMPDFPQRQETIIIERSELLQMCRTGSMDNIERYVDREFFLLLMHISSLYCR
jgi:hypothetical protein